jgi:hypothetical protein
MVQQGQKRWNRLAVAVMGIGIAALLASGVLFVLMLTGTVGDDGNSVPETITGIKVEFTPEPSPTAPPPPPSESPIGNLVIPRFGVDAGVVVLGLDSNGVMIAPSGPEDVAWYDFTGRPGMGPDNKVDGEPCCNSVYSGHVDYAGYGPAVFYDISSLEANDLIEVHMTDGTVYRYAVFSKEQVYASTADAGAITGGTPNEIITLITCGGTFDSSSGQYDQRVIVKAERVYGDVPVGATSAQ